MATSLVNIIINHDTAISSSEINFLEQNLFKHISDTLWEHTLTLFSLQRETYFKTLRSLNYNSLQGIVITVCNQFSNEVIAGSHSNRFHSLEISEKFNSLPVINIQVTDQRGLDSITFSTGDFNLTKSIINSINSFYSKNYMEADNAKSLVNL